MRITPVTNSIALTSATTVFGATTVLIQNTGTTQRTITVANTVSAGTRGGGQYGIPAGNASQATLLLLSNAVPGGQIIVNKKSTDTISGGHSEVKGTGIANSGDT